MCTNRGDKLDAREAGAEPRALLLVEICVDQLRIVQGELLNVIRRFNLNFGATDGHFGWLVT